MPSTTKAAAVTAAALALALAAPAALARDVYKGSLDPGIPKHRAILDTLEKLKANPKDAALKNDLGCLIAQEGFWRDAVREFEEAADLDRKDGKPLFNAGLVHAWREEWRAARSDFRKATRRDPGNWPAWWMAGFCEEQLDNFDAAVAAYKISLRVDTSLFDVAVNPFAARTRLKARVLLETYDRRVAQAGQPVSQQLADPDRIASFLQRRPATAVAAAPPPAAEEPAPSPGGPVVTSATSGPSSPPGTSGPKGWVPPPVARPVSRRAAPPPDEEEDEGSRRVQPADTAAGSEKAPDTPSPGPGFGVGTPRKPRPTPNPQ